MDNKESILERDPLKEQEEESNSEKIEENLQSSDLKKEINELKDTILRLRADNENTRKRFSRELGESRSYSISGFAKELVEVLENLNRAIDNIPKEEVDLSESMKSFSEGVIMTQKILEDSFKKHGIVRVYPMLEKFDHNYHQAISQAVDNEKDPDTVIQVIQAGYKISDRLLRPALVVVSKRED